MLGIGFGEILVVAVVLILVVGPESMPRLMKALARGIREFRKAARDLRQQVGLDELLEEEELRDLRSLRRDPFGLREVDRELRRDVHAWMSQVDGPEPGQPVPPDADGASGEPGADGASGEPMAEEEAGGTVASSEEEAPAWPRPLPAAQAVPKDPRAWAPKVVRERMFGGEEEAGAPRPGQPLPFDPTAGEDVEGQEGSAEGSGTADGVPGEPGREAEGGR